MRPPFLTNPDGKFVGFVVHDVLRELDLGPDPTRYCDAVQIDARVNGNCILRYRYRVGDDPGGTPRFTADTRLVDWRRLMTALETSGLLGAPLSWVRGVMIEAPADGPCTITVERYAPKSVCSVIEEGVQLADDPRLAVVR